MKTKWFVIGSGTLFIAGTCAARADIIATHTDFSAGMNNTASTFRVHLGLGFEDPTSTIFDNILLSASDVGKTFVVSAANDPNYNAFVAGLTDGNDTYVDYELSFNNFNSIASGVSSEKKLFFAPLPPGNGIDLQGYSLDSIDLRIDSVTIDPTDFAIQTTILIDPISTAPEPSAAALALVAGSGALWRVRRRP